MTDDDVLADEKWPDRAADVLEAGGPDVALHLRGPATEPRRLLELVDALVEPARRARALLLVNDRVDVALLAEVGGVHLGERSLPAERTRALLGADAWIGVSCHAPEETGGRATEGADYVFLGTIHPTASHPGVTGLGAAGVEEAARDARLPLIGIGGIGPAEASAVLAAGAHGVAAIRGIWRAEDPGRAVKRYLEVLSDQGAVRWKQRTRFISD